MAKHAMPVSKAKTAYGLLSEIRKLIVEEPKRYNQGVWGTPGFIKDEFMPACGTVCCVAGWVVALKDVVPDYTLDTPHTAAAILGLSTQIAEPLFEADAAGNRYSPSGYLTHASVRAHARRGAKHIERFQKKYAKQLKAKRV